MCDIFLCMLYYVIFPLRTSKFADHGSARKAPTCHRRSSPRTRPCTASSRSSLEKSRPKRIDPSTTRGDGWNWVKPWVKHDENWRWKNIAYDIWEGISRNPKYLVYAESLQTILISIVLHFFLHRFLFIFLYTTCWSFDKQTTQICSNLKLGGFGVWMVWPAFRDKSKFDLENVCCIWLQSCVFGAVYMRLVSLHFGEGNTNTSC